MMFSMPPTRLLGAAYIGSTPNSLRNLQLGLEQQTWGTPSGAPSLPPHTPYLILATNYSGGSPRTPLEAFQTGTVTAVLCTVTTAPYTGTAPLWGDEIAANTVLYPQRFGIEPLATITLRLDDPRLPGDFTDTLRRSGIQRGYVLTTPLHDTAPLLQTFGLDPTHPLSSAPGADPLISSITVRQARGAGRTLDPIKRARIEQHAVQRAHTYLHGLGYTDLVDIGAPYDIEATGPGGTIHVEVKGTTGAGGTIELTRNEVHHHRHRPGGMLIVVSDITYDPTLKECRGGTLRAWHHWSAHEDDLIPTRYEYRVPPTPTDTQA